jgi:N-acetylneuraminate lyase
MAKFHINEIKGVIPALLTPFSKNEELDEKGLRALISFLIGEGVNGLYLTGSTGEGFLMDLDERKRAVEIAIDETAGRVPIIVHVGAISTKLSVDLAKHADQAGADAISSVPPFYYKFSEAQVIEYYKDLAEASPLPMIVYNIPLAGLIGYDTIKKIAQIPGVKGIKYTATTHFEINQIKSEIGKDFMVYSGADEMALSGLLAGADGIIGSTYNVIPDTFIKIYKAFKEGDIIKANDIMNQGVEVIMQLLKYGSFMSLLKAINRWRGIPAGYSRKPFSNFTEEEEEKIKADLIGLKEKKNIRDVKFLEELAK